MKKAINTEKAPKAIGPYSQAVMVDGFLFVSGQIPLDPATGNMVEGGIEEQVHRVLKNIGAILNEADMDFSDVVKSTVFLDSMDDFSKVNEIYARYFNGAILPARAAVQVGKLPKGALIEIEVIAHK